MGRQRFFGNKAHGVGFVSGGAAYDLADPEVIVIGNKTYEIDIAGGGVVPGNIQIDLTGATSAAEAVAIIVAVINANKPSIPVTATIHPFFADCFTVIATNRGAAGNMPFTTTMATGTSSISGTGLLEYGENGGSQTEARGSYVIQAEDVAALGFVIDTGLQTPQFFVVEARSSTGVFKAYDGLVAIVGAEIQGDDGGSVDLVAGDVVTWGAWE